MNEEIKDINIKLDIEDVSDLNEDLKVYKDERQRNRVRSTIKKLTTKLITKNQKQLNELKNHYEEENQKRKYEKHELLRLRKQIFLTYRENIKMKEENDSLKEQIAKLNIANKRRRVLSNAINSVKKKHPTIVQEFKLNQKVVLFRKDGTSPADEIFKRALKSHDKKSRVNIRSVTLIKLINTIVNDYSNMLKEELIVQTQPLYIFIYEYFAAKHGGLKKVLETKYRQFLAACDFHKKIPAVYLFCRFLGIIEPLEVELFRTYIAILDLLQKYNKYGVEIIGSETDEPLIPSIRCNEVISHYFKGKYTESELLAIRNDIARITKPCPRCINQGVVEKTELVLFIIHHYKNFLQLSTNNVKDLFDAGDLNGDTFLQFEEFDMLFRCIESSRYTPKISKMFFASYSDLIAEMNGQNIPAISYNRFTIFALEKDYFKIEAQNKFIGDLDINSICKRIQVLHNKCSQVIGEIKWRVKKSGQDNSNIFDMIDTLKKRLQDNDQRRAVYMAYLLIDYDSKYQAIDSKVETFLPDITGYYKLVNDQYLNKKSEMNIVKRQITWRESLESISDWEEKEGKQ